MRLTESEFAELMGDRSNARNKTARAPTGGIKQSKGGRKKNKTETRFELSYLGPMLVDGALRVVRFEAVTLRLANGLVYTPDFWAITRANETVFYEVKGPYIREDGKIKLKMAAQTYPDYTFYLARWADNEWWIERVWPS